MGKIRNGEWIDFMIDTLGITIDPQIDEYIDARTYIEEYFLNMILIHTLIWRIKT